MPASSRRIDYRGLNMGKKVLMTLGTLGVLALSVKEFPALVREVKIWRMGSAPQGPARRPRFGAG